ncbi:MAG: heavy metal translocating P-type ATPase [Chloroflexota bacterium]
MSHTQTYTVTGMDCASCAQNLENGISKLDGVTAVSVNMMTERIEVNGTATLDDLRRLPFAVRLSRFATRLIGQNIALSVGVKAVFALLAVAGLHHCGWLFSQTWACCYSSASTVYVP